MILKKIDQNIFGEFISYQEGWELANEQEADNYFLNNYSKPEKLALLESNYTAAQRIYLKNGHTFIVNLKGNDFLDMERQVNAARNLGSASLISVDTTGVLRVINNIPYAIWLEFYEPAKNISVSNLALKSQTIFAIKNAQSIVGLEAINMNPFPAIQTIILNL